MMEIMIESDVLARILAYVAENKTFAASKTESHQILVVKAIKPKNSWEDQSGFTGQTTTSKSRRLDCIYDDEPLGFEKDPIILNRKMHVQVPLEEVDLGDRTTK